MQRRAAFREVRERSQQLVAILLEAGPARMHNVDELLLKESMDVIGALPPLPSLHSARKDARRLCMPCKWLVRQKRPFSLDT